MTFILKNLAAKWAKLKILDSLAPKSDEAPFIGPTEPFITLGATRDYGIPVRFSYAKESPHFLLVGQQGIPKETIGYALLEQQTKNKGGWVAIEAGCDPIGRNRLWGFAKAESREKDFYELNFSGNEWSHSFNPLIGGTAQSSVEILMVVGDAVKVEGTSALHRKSFVRAAVETVVSALHSANQRYTFEDIRLLFQSKPLLRHLESLVPSGAVRDALTVFIKAQGKTLNVDFKDFRHRIQMLSQGINPGIFNTYTPDISLFDILANDKMLAIQLDWASSPEVAKLLGQMVMCGLAQAGEQLLSTDRSETLVCPLVFANCIENYETEAVYTLFKQAEPAKIWLMPVICGLSFNGNISARLEQTLAQNTGTKIFFKLGGPDEAKSAAEFIENNGVADGRRVIPDEVLNLGMREAIVASGSSRYHIAPALASDELRKNEVSDYPYRFNHLSKLKLIANEEGPSDSHVEFRGQEWLSKLGEA